MRKIIVTLIVAALISATSAAPVFAHGWGGHRGVVIDPFWPIAAALAIPEAIVGTVANLAVPEPVYYAPSLYSGPATYYAPRPSYYAPRVYVTPRGYDSPRAYYPVRYYRTYRGGW